MSVTSTDLGWYLATSIPTSDGAAVGGAISGTTMDGVDPNEIFHTVAARPAGGSDLTTYSKVFVKNSNGSTPLTSSKIWIVSQEHSPQLTMALASSNGTAVLDDTQSLADAITAPAGTASVTFSLAASEGAAIDVGNSGSLTAASAQGIWLKRFIAAGTAADASVPFTLRVKGETV